jgi:hypothetical protein
MPMDAFKTPDEAPALDLSLGLHGGGNDQQRSLAKWLVALGQELSPVIDALEQDGDEATSKLAQLLTPARNAIDAALYVLVAGEES